MTDGDQVRKVGALDALKGMLSFFTIVRLNVGEREFGAMERSFWLAPVIGLLNGLVAFLALVLLDVCDVPAMVQAAVAIAVVCAFSKFLHFDGLADFGDGMVVSSERREDHVRALKDSLIGAGALGTAVTVTLLTFACYAGLASFAAVPLAVVPAEVLAKNSMVAAAAFGEPGDGMASRQVSCTGAKSLILSAVLSVVLIATTWLLVSPVAGWLGLHHPDIGPGLAVWMVALPLLASVLVGRAMARAANRTFGFVNGDVLGATNEVSRPFVLLAALIVLGLGL